MTHFDAIVIGSGPSGVICAEKLTENNIRTLILDYGLEIENEKKQLISELKNLDISEWTKKHRAKLKNKNYFDSDNFVKKYSYGSSFVYDKSIDEIGLKTNDIGYNPSLSKGGLSNVWGSAVLPYMKMDFKDWPIDIADCQ